MLVGVIKGLGMQSLACIYALIGYLAIGLPLSYFLAFNWQGLLPEFMDKTILNGLFLGIIVGCIILNLAMLRIIHILDWKQHSP